MKITAIAYLILVIYATLFGNIKYNGQEVDNLFTRFFIAIFFCTIMTAILVLPICGILYLIQ